MIIPSLLSRGMRKERRGEGREREEGGERRREGGDRGRGRVRRDDLCLFFSGSERAKLEQEKQLFEEDCVREESKYHYMNCMSDVLDTQLFKGNLLLPPPLSSPLFPFSLHPPSLTHSLFIIQQMKSVS